MLVTGRDNATLLLAQGVVTLICSAKNDSRLVVRWVEINLEGLAAVARKADFGGYPAADQHDMRQQPAERQLGAELLFEVPEVAAGGQRLVHVLAEHVLCHYAGLNVAVSLQRRRTRCQECVNQRILQTREGDRAVRSLLGCCVCSRRASLSGSALYNVCDTGLKRSVNGMLIRYTGRTCLCTLKVMHVKLIFSRHAFLLANMLFQTAPGRVLDCT